MKVQRVKLGDVASFRKISVKPEAGTTYHCYSLPAFDNDKAPEILDGGEILSNKLSINGNDILVNKLNMRFKRIWRIDKLEQNSVCSTEFLPLVVNDDVNRDFVYYVLLSDEFTRELSGMRTGTSGSHQRVKPEWILDYELNLPPLATQTQIARILSAFDSKIEVNNKLNAKLEELLIALFHKLDFDCTGCEEAKIGDFCDVFTGKLNANQFDEDGQYPFFTCGENILKINSYIFDGPAIIISGNGSYTGRTNFYEGKFNLYQRTYACTPKEHLDENLIYALYPLIRTHLHEKISGGTHGSSIPYIVQGDITNFEFDFSLEKYVDFGKTSRRFLKQLQANSLENEKLATLRDTLLPKLMRGELIPNP